MRHMLAALLAFTLTGAAAAQEQGGNPPAGRGGRVGVTIDLGGLLHGAARLLGGQPDAAYVDGEIILGWSATQTSIDPDALAREFQGILRAQRTGKLGHRRGRARRGQQAVR